LSRVDTIPLTNYLLDAKKFTPKCENSASDSDCPEKSSAKFSPLATEGNSLPIGFRIFIKAKMNESQLNAITAAASEYGDGGFTLIKGPPGKLQVSDIASYCLPLSSFRAFNNSQAPGKHQH
jgi:hypothetical protein